MRQVYVLILALCASVTCLAQEPLSGKFTVNSKGDQVQFAPGNLQYVISSKIWQFAESQTEIIGKDAAYVTANPGYGGAIDLFPWGEDYGSYIGTGWRLLTDEEWQYLLREEEIGYGSSYAGQATIGTQHGLMLVPDGWQPFATLTFSPSPNNWTTNSYAEANMSSLEESGVVFLPCVGEMGSYWSATPKGESNAYGMYFSASAIEAGYSSARSNNYAVRLVKDVKETPTDIENVQSDNAQCTKVLRNGQIYLMYKGTMYNVQGKALKR
jgi:hypothetical protein